MIRAAAVGLAAVLAVGLAGCGAGPQASGDDKVFGEKVRAYLLAHPEVLREVSDKLQAKEEADQAKAMADAERAGQAALPVLRAALERDPRDFVANPDGKLTVTEFYDYRCPHCVNAAPKVVALIHQHPEVRFVFKEMPIFGPISEHASRAALAAKAQGRDYVGLYQAMMATHPLTDQDIDRLAAAKGVDLSEMNAPAFQAKTVAQLVDVSKLAGKLSIDGTPAFIVGNVIVPGEDLDAVNDAISHAEGKPRSVASLPLAG